MNDIKIRLNCMICNKKLESITDHQIGMDKNDDDLIYVRITPCNCTLQKLKDIINDA